MEEHSEPMKITLCQDTYELLKDEFVCSEHGEFDIKGFGTQRLYFLDSERKRQPHPLHAVSIVQTSSKAPACEVRMSSASRSSSLMLAVWAASKSSRALSKPVSKR